MFSFKHLFWLMFWLPSSLFFKPCDNFYSEWKCLGFFAIERELYCSLMTAHQRKIIYVCHEFALLLLQHVGKLREFKMYYLLWKRLFNITGFPSWNKVYITMNFFLNLLHNRILQFPRRLKLLTFTDPDLGRLPFVCIRFWADTPGTLSDWGSGG